MSYLGYGSVTMQSAPCVPVKQERRKKKEGGRGALFLGLSLFAHWVLNGYVPLTFFSVNHGICI